MYHLAGQKRPLCDFLPGYFKAGNEISLVKGQLRELCKSRLSASDWQTEYR